MYVRRLTKLSPSLLAVVAAMAWTHARPEFTGDRLTFLSVGQGDCTVVQVGGRTILIDTGPRSDFGDAGATIVVPALYRLGVRELDVVILTHSDMDHIGGLIAISRHFPVSEVLFPAGCVSDTDLQRVLGKSSYRQQRALAGHEVWRSPGIEILLDTPRAGEMETPNDNSVFVRLKVRDATATITGDASFAEEDLMLSRGRVLPSQLLHAGHHGSRSSTSEELLDQVNPDIVVISLGRHNTYGHPSPKVLDRINASGAETLRTDRDGSLTFTPRGGRWVRD
jgi:competence protein ComEC